VKHVYDDNSNITSTTDARNITVTAYYDHLNRIYLTSYSDPNTPDVSFYYDVQKEKLPFFIYAYCLMANHVHLLIERMTDDIGRIMHRVKRARRRYKRSIGPERPTLGRV
jgi:hypothetical protein